MHRIEPPAERDCGLELSRDGPGEVRAQGIASSRDEREPGLPEGLIHLGERQQGHEVDVARMVAGARQGP